MTVWSGLVDRQEVGINWWVVRNPTQADPTFQVGWEVRQRTNFATFDFDGEVNWWGQSGNGSSRRRLSGSQEMVHGSGVMNLTAVYGGIGSFGIGAESRTWSNSGGSAATAWARMQRNGDIPRRPTGNPTNPGTPTTSNLTATSVRIAWTRPADMRGTSFVRDEWQVSTNQNFTAVIRSGNQTGGAAIDVTGLAPGTRFWTRVRTVGNGWDASGRTSGWSGAREFRTPTRDPNAPGAPTFSGVQARQAIIGWTASTDMGGTTLLGFDAQVATDANFSNLVHNVRNTSRSRTITGLSPSTRYFVRARTIGTGWDATRTGPWSATRDFTTPIVAPGAPSAMTARRDSDAAVWLGWTRSTAGGTATHHDIQASINGAAWTDAWTVGNVASHSGGFAANRRQTYRVRARNGAGASAWSPASAPIFSTPAAPTPVTATRVGQQVRIDFTNRVAFAEHRHEIQRGTQAANGTIAWDSGVLATLPAGTTSWTHTNPNAAVVNVYRVRAVNTTGGLSSGWTQSNSVQLLAAPQAPQVSAPPAFARHDQPLTIRWAHRPVDASVQRAYVIQWSADGFTSQAGITGTITSDASSHTFPAGTFPAGATLAFRMRTWGAHADGSPWSAATAVTQFVTRPSAFITSPPEGEVVTASTVTVAGGHAQDQGAALVTATVELLRGGQVLDAQTIAGQLLATFTGLSDRQTYTVRATVTDSHGMVSEPVERTFAVAYPAPMAPDVSATFLAESGAAQITASLPGQPGAVYRRNLSTLPRSTEYLPMGPDQTWSGVLAPNTIVPDTDTPHGQQFVTRFTAPEAVTFNETHSAFISWVAGEHAEEGETYSAGLWVRPAADTLMCAQALFFDQEGQATAVPGPVVLCLAGHWTRLAVEGVTAPEGTTRMRFDADFAAGVSLDEGFTLDVAACLIEVGALLGEFFDGASVGDGQVEPFWLGPMQTSASELRFLPGQPKTVTVTRSIDGGPPQVLLSGHPWDGSEPLNVLDPVPTVNGSNVYEIVASTDEQAASAPGSAEAVSGGGRLAFLNTGPSMEHLLPFRGAAKVSSAPRRVSELVEMAGRTLPVALFGPNEGLTLEVETELLDATLHTVGGIETFLRTAGLCCYRDPSGRRLFGRVTGAVTGWYGRQATLRVTIEEAQ